MKKLLKSDSPFCLETKRALEVLEALHSGEGVLDAASKTGTTIEEVKKLRDWLGRCFGGIPLELVQLADLKTAINEESAGGQLVLPA